MIKSDTILNRVPDLRILPNNKETYSMIRQDATTNQLARVSSKTGITAKEFTTTGIIQTQNGNTDLQVIINEYGKVALKQSTSKLLRLLTIHFTEKGSQNKTISIPLKEAMQDLGLKDVKTARANIKKDLEALYNVSCEAHKTNRKGERDFIKFRILDMQGIKNGIIHVNLSDAIYTHLRSCELMPYPKELLKIESNSNKNPYAFYLGDKIAELKKYNQYDKATANIKESFIIAVKTLLKVCFDNGMPNYETVQSTDRQVEDRIIKPFERDLDACSVNIFDWEYCNPKGVKLSNNQLESTTFKDFEARYIKVAFKDDYPITDYDIKKYKQTSKKKAKDKGKKTA